MASEGQCIWIYAVADQAPPALPEGLTGIGGRPVRAIAAAGLTAVVADVEPAEFGEAALRRNLEDLGWLEETARAHHHVIEAVATRCPVVPMRLATIYRSDATAAAMLSERTADFRRALSRTSGRQEWGVKAYAARPADPHAGSGPAAGSLAGSGPAAGGLGGSGPAAGSRGGPGAAYLQRRRAQLAATEDARRAAMATARDLHDDLCAHAVAARLYPPQAADLSGQAAPMILNASYLVDAGRADEFAAAVAALADQQPFVRLALTGPWPAYSFVSEDEDGERR